MPAVSVSRSALSAARTRARRERAALGDCQPEEHGLGVEQLVAERVPIGDLALELAHASSSERPSARSAS